MLKRYWVDQKNCCLCGSAHYRPYTDLCESCERR